MKKKAKAKGKGRPTTRKVVLERRSPQTSPGKVGGRERTIEPSGDWPRVGRRPSEEVALLASLAADFKSIREAKGISIAQLAKRTNTAPATLIKFEERAAKLPLMLLLELSSNIGATLKIAKQ